MLLTPPRPFELLGEEVVEKNRGDGGFEEYSCISSILVYTRDNMKERHDSYCTGLAAEHLIMSCLTRLGLEVYLTMGNRKKTDIRVIDPISSRASSVDVKAVKGYSSLIVNNVKASSDHFVVFVVFNERLHDPSYMPDIFIVPSLEVESITSHYKEEKRVMKSKLDIYKNRWDYLKSNEETKTSTETF